MRAHWTRFGLGIWALILGGCAARAAPVEAEGVVRKAGPAAPVAVGSPCTLSLWPAWRQGVNCQMLLRCGGVDLFGGQRIGGYAVCDTEDYHFTTALDGQPRDGDPALDLDVEQRRILWEDRDPTATLEIALLELKETTPRE